MGCADIIPPNKDPRKKTISGGGREREELCYKVSLN
jgi:hypothetical protein